MSISNDELDIDTNGSGSHQERLVKLRCACGCDFEREQLFLDRAEKYKTEYPSVARFYQRKIEHCDKCLHEKMNRSLKALPDILKALAT